MSLSDISIRRPVFATVISLILMVLGIIALVGAFTALFAATIAVTQVELKKVLAYSTVSQLGFMFMGCGVGAFSAGFFHVFTHAFFKACLFLGAGSVIHAMHARIHDTDRSQDMRNMGGLAQYLPITRWTFLLSCFAIAGAPPLAGFWSKDEILAGTGGMNDANGTYYFVLVMLLLGAFCTAAYMTRTVWYAFFGEFRGHGHPHESGPRITIPLIVLSVLAVVAGTLDGDQGVIHHLALRFAIIPAEAHRHDRVIVAVLIAKPVLLTNAAAVRLVRPEGAAIHIVVREPHGLMMIVIRRSGMPHARQSDARGPIQRKEARPRIIRREMPARRLAARDLQTHRMIRLRHNLALREVKRLSRLLRPQSERGSGTQGSGKKVSACVHEAI